MFEPQDAPRVFGLAPGVDFPKELAVSYTHLTLPTKA